MIANLLFLLISYSLAGSKIASSPSILASFNEKIETGDTNALQSILYSNSKFIQSSAAKPYINNGFIMAVHKGHTSVVELMLKNPNINAAINNNVAIRMASANGDVDIVKLLLARPEVNPGAKTNEALIDAANFGHTEVVRLLLDHPNVKSSARNYQAIISASRMNHADIVKLLIHDGRDIPTSVSFYTLERAAHFQDVDLVQFLLEYPSFNQLVDLLLFGDDLLTIKTIVAAGYTLNQDILELISRYTESHGNIEIAEYLKSLKIKPKLHETSPISMTEQCAICLTDDNLLEGYMTTCRHQFHAECLQSWITVQNSCPMCRTFIL